MIFILFPYSFCLKISSISVNLDYNGSINGLIRKLQKNYSEIENSGILIMSASSIYPGGYYPKNVLYDDNSFFHTGKSIPGEYLQFDFLENLISISSYTIKSRNNGCQSKNWKVNASIDGIKWNTIDEVIEDTYMCSNLVTKSFSIKDQSKYRFIRFISTGIRCCPDRNFLNIFVIEFFGSINYIYKSISYEQYNFKSLFKFTFILIFLIL